MATKGTGLSNKNNNKQQDEEEASKQASNTIECQSRSKHSQKLLSFIVVVGRLLACLLVVFNQL